MVLVMHALGQQVAVPRWLPRTREPSEELTHRRMAERAVAPPESSIQQIVRGIYLQRATRTAAHIYILE